MNRLKLFIALLVVAPAAFPSDAELQRELSDLRAVMSRDAKI